MFKVNDLVIGNEKNEYGYTAENALCVVIKDEDRRGEMRVKLIDVYKSNVNSMNIGVQFDVQSRYFDLFE